MAKKSKSKRKRQKAREQQSIKGTNPIQEIVQSVDEISEAAEQITISAESMNRSFGMTADSAKQLLQLITRFEDRVEGIPEQVLRAQIGLQDMSKIVGYLNQEVHDHSRHLLQIKNNYDNLSGAGKDWLNSMNFDNMVDRARESLTAFNGMFFESRNAITAGYLQMGQTLGTVGTANYQSMFSTIQGIDTQLQTLNERIKDSTEHTDLQMLGWLQTRQSMISARDVLMQMDGLNGMLNEKLNMVHGAIDKVQEKAEQFKGALAVIPDLLNNIGLDFVGMSQIIEHIDVSTIFDTFKQTVNDSTIRLAHGIGAMKTDGANKFKELGKIGAGMFGNLAKSVVTVFKSAFKMVLFGGIAVLGALILSAITRLDQLQSAYNQAQLSANALSGQASNFGDIYSALGGDLGGEKAVELYSTMNSLKDVTVPTAQAVQVMNRNFGVAASTSAQFLQTMRHVRGMSQETSNKFAAVVGNIAVANKLQPNKLFQEMNRSAEGIATYWGSSDESMMKQVGFAKKLNISVEQMVRTMQGLTDIQQTIEDAFAASLMTGKDIDIQQLVTLAANDDAAGALSLIVDSVGDGFDQMKAQAKQSVAKILNMSVSDFSTAFHAIKDSGKSANQVLSQMGKKSLKDDTLGKIGTHAGALLTRMEALARGIKDAIANAFRPVVDFLLSKGVSLKDFYVGILNKIGAAVAKVMQWIMRPQNQQALSNFFNNAVKSGEKLFTGVILPMIKGLLNLGKTLMWIYQKGGLVGLLGAVGLGAAVLNIGSIINTVSAFKNLVNTASKAADAVAKTADAASKVAQAADTTSKLSTVAASAAGSGGVASQAGSVIKNHQKIPKSVVDNAIKPKTPRQISDYGSSQIKQLESKKHLKPSQRNKLSQLKLGQERDQSRLDALAPKDNRFEGMTAKTRTPTPTTMPMQSPIPIEAPESITEKIGGAKEGLSQASPVSEKIKEAGEAGQASGKGASGLQDIANAVLKFAAAVLILSVALAVVAAVAASGYMGEALLGLSALVGLIGVLAVMSKIGGKQVGPTLMMMAGAVGILAVSLLIISAIDPARLVNSTVALTALVVLIGVLAIASKLAGAVGVAGILAMAGAVGILSGALWVISQIDPAKLNSSLMALGGLVILVGILAVISTVVGPVGVGIMLAMAGAVLAFAGSLWLLSTIDFSKMATMAPAMVKVSLAVGAMSAALALAAIPMSIGGAALLVLSTALLVFGVAIIVIAKGFDMFVGTFTKLSQLSEADIPKIKEVIVAFTGVVATAMKSLFTEIKNISMWGAAKILVIIKGFSNLVKALKSLYDIAKAPDAIGKLTSALEDLAESDVGKLIGDMMAKLAKSLEGTKRRQAKTVSAMMESFSDLAKSLQSFISLTDGAVKKKDGTWTLPIVDKLKETIKQLPPLMNTLATMMMQIDNIASGKSKDKSETQEIKDRLAKGGGIINDAIDVANLGIKSIAGAIGLGGNKFEAKSTGGMMESFANMATAIKSITQLDLSKFDSEQISKFIGKLIPEFQKLNKQLQGNGLLDENLVMKFYNSLVKIGNGMIHVNKNFITKTFQNSITNMGNSFASVMPHYQNFALTITKLSKALKQLSLVPVKKIDEIFKKMLQIQAVQTLGKLADASKIKGNNVSEKMLNDTLKLTKLAQGGIVESPTIALIGEAGPEAVVPLKDSAYAGMNTLDKSDKKDKKDNVNVLGLQNLVSQLKKMSDRPIQVILNVDGQKLADVVANHTNPSYG